MKLKLSNKHCKFYKVKVTDADGNVEIFDNVNACAKALGVKPQTVYSAICYGRTVRGCVLERLTQFEDFKHEFKKECEDVKNELRKACEIFKEEP